MGSLEPKHLQDWQKRLRERVAPLKLRFVSVGEYGDVTERPHYHSIVFGLPTCRLGRTLRWLPSSRPMAAHCCERCRLVQSTWEHGDVDLGTAEYASALYVAGYTEKKLTNAHDENVRKWLAGRLPEFARHSRRPGIGVPFLWDLASTLIEHGLDKEDACVDVPSTLRHGNKILPLGPFMTRKLRTLVGRDEKTPQAKLDEMEEELQPLRAYAFNSSIPLQKALNEKYEGAIQALLNRNHIFKQQKGKL